MTAYGETASYYRRCAAIADGKSSGCRCVSTCDLNQTRCGKACRGNWFSLQLQPPPHYSGACAPCCSSCVYFLFYFFWLDFATPQYSTSVAPPPTVSLVPTIAKIERACCFLRVSSALSTALHHSGCAIKYSRSRLSYRHGPRDPPTRMLAILHLPFQDAPVAHLLGTARHG